MERNDLMAGVGANRLRAGCHSRHRLDGESRRFPDDRMLWKGTALMRFALFTTINSVLSNAAELRLKTHHVVVVPMENRHIMTRRDGASEHPNLNEWCDYPQGGTPRTPPARGPAVAESKTDLHLNCNDVG
jgi:hypothetical protein